MRKRIAEHLVGGEVRSAVFLLLQNSFNTR